MKLLEHYIDIWLAGPVVSLAHIPSLSTDVHWGSQTKRKFCLFVSPKGTQYAFIPTITASLEALGEPWLKSLERQVAIANWGAGQDLRYLGEKEIKLVLPEGVITPNEFYELEHQNWLPEYMPRVRYLGFQCDGVETLIPESNIRQPE